MPQDTYSTTLDTVLSTANRVSDHIYHVGQSIPAIEQLLAVQHPDAARTSATNHQQILEAQFTTAELDMPTITDIFRLLYLISNLDIGSTDQATIIYFIFRTRTIRTYVMRH